MKTIPIGVLSLALLIAALPAMGDDISLKLSPDGVAVEAPGVGHLVVPPPTLSASDTDYTGDKPQVSMEDPNTLLAKYQIGFEVRMSIGTDGKSIEYKISHPLGSGGVRITMQIPIEVGMGGSFGFNGDALKPFPATVANKGEQKLAALDASTFKVVGGNGTGFSLTVPSSWQSLEDDRAYNWSIYEYHYLYDFKRYTDNNSFTLQFQSIAPDPAATTPTAPGKP